MHTLKYYIVADVKNRNHYELLKNALNKTGHFEISYDWMKDYDTYTQLGSIDARTQGIIDLKLEAMCSSHVIIVLLPSSIDAFVELGMAIALNTVTFVVSEDERASMLYKNRAVRYLRSDMSVNDIINRLYEDFRADHQKEINRLQETIDYFVRKPEHEPK